MFFYLISCVASHLKFKDIIVFKMNRMIVLLYFVTFIVFSSGVTESNFDAIFTSSLDDNGTVVMTKQHGSGYSDDAYKLAVEVLVIATSCGVMATSVVVGCCIFWCQWAGKCRREVRGLILSPMNTPNQIIIQTSANVQPQQQVQPQQKQQQQVQPQKQQQQVQPQQPQQQQVQPQQQQQQVQPQQQQQQVQPQQPQQQQVQPQQPQQQQVQPQQQQQVQPQQPQQQVQPQQPPSYYEMQHSQPPKGEISIENPGYIP